jgi:ABC-type multidrug transport system fused ATPase/permease subunit
MGFLRLKSGDMLLGEVPAFYQVTAQLFVPISALVGMTIVSQTLGVYADRVFQMLDSKSEIPADGALKPVDGDIVFDHVTLKFSEGGPFAIDRLSLTIPQGKTTAIVGPTGCGKSTIILLLTRLLDPNQGTISIGGFDIEDFVLHDYRRSVGNVLFDTKIFSGTVSENVAFGTKNLMIGDIRNACRVVELDTAMSAFPRGYETRLGTGGMQLSDEETLKLNLARAIVTKPEIVTVDDTYAQVGEETERRLRVSLREALPNATMVIATSRLSIAESCDSIYVLQKGSVAEFGSHEQLMEMHGLYRRMYARQMGMEI